MYAFQPLIIGEAAMDKFFSVRHGHGTKLLLERRGKTVEAKFTNTRKFYKEYQS
jgi:hypothetical protein